MAGDYQIFVVDMDGSIHAGSGAAGELVNATVTRFADELNGVAGAEITVPTTDPEAALMAAGREIQIRRDGDVVFWGPIVRPRRERDRSSWQCAGLLWYFDRRYMGRADRVNQLTNGDFEDGETGWSFTGVTHSIDTTPPGGGPGGDALFLTGPSADHASYATQTWTHGTGGHPLGDYLTGSVWAYVPEADYVGGAANDYGLVLIHRRGSVVVTGAFAEIGDDTPKDEWVALEAGIPNVLPGDTVEVRLFPPHGDAYFDLAMLTFMESLSFGYPGPGEDVTTIIEGIVGYAQDPAAGKSDLNIGFAGDPTGAVRQIAYQFAEHRNILDAIMEFVRQGVCDISVELTTTTRTFTVWPTAVTADPRGLGKGSYKPDLALVFDDTIFDFADSADWQQAATNVIVLGPGDGPDRPEGGAADPSALGGLALEHIETAADDVTVGQLDAQARTLLATLSNPQIIEAVSDPGGPSVADVDVGDTVPVTISCGVVDIDGTYRVMRKDYNPRTDQATFTLQPT